MNTTPNRQVLSDLLVFWTIFTTKVHGIIGFVAEFTTPSLLVRKSLGSCEKVEKISCMHAFIEKRRRKRLHLHSNEVPLLFIRTEHFCHLKKLANLSSIKDIVTDPAFQLQLCTISSRQQQLSRNMFLRADESSIANKGTWILQTTSCCQRNLPLMLLHT